MFRRKPVEKATTPIAIAPNGTYFSIEPIAKKDQWISIQLRKLGSDEMLKGLELGRNVRTEDITSYFRNFVADYLHDQEIERINAERFGIYRVFPRKEEA